MEIAGNKGWIGEVEQHGSWMVKVTVPGLGMEHKGEVVAEKKADNEQQEADQAGGHYPAINHLLILVTVDVGCVIGSNEDPDNGEPEGCHQDRTCVDEMTIEYLDKEQRSYSEVNGQGNGKGKFLGNLFSQRAGFSRAVEVPDKGNDDCPEHDIHEQDVKEKGEQKQKLKPAPVYGNGIRSGDQSSRVHGCLLAVECNEKLLLPRNTRNTRK